MDMDDAQTAVSDIAGILRDWAKRANSDMSFADWATLVEEIKDSMEGHADSLDEVHTWLTDDAHREAAESIADDLEGQHGPTVDAEDEDEDNSFEAGIAAAAEYLRTQY